MTHAKAGDSVHVHYTGRLSDGSVFDSSEGREPLEFTLGEGEVIPGFEEAVSGMHLGETRTVTVPAGDAYGERRPEMVMRVDRSEFPPEIAPAVGQQFQVVEGEQAMVVTVVEVDEEHVVLDANHPLAGEDLTFNLELVGIE